MDPFSLFTNHPYTFLEVEQTTDGNVIKSEHQAEGIVKVRTGIRQTGLGEVEGGSYVDNAPTLKVKPDEPFLTLIGKNMEGHGIRVSMDGSEPKEYRIVGQTPGYDYDEGKMVFYKVTLKKESFASWESQDLPLS